MMYPYEFEDFTLSRERRQQQRWFGKCSNLSGLSWTVR